MKASNRWNVITSNHITSDSQEKFRNAVSGRDLGSPSTPGIVGKVSNKRAEQPRGRDAEARTKPSICGASYTPSGSGMRKRLAALMLLAVVITSNPKEQLVATGCFHTTVAVEADGWNLRASLQVARHVTKRQTGVKASNRWNVITSNHITSDSQEKFRNAVSGRDFVRWSVGIDTSAKPANVSY